MKQNVGKTDRYMRIGLGILIVAAGIYFQSWWGVVAVVPFVTAFTGFCPLYKILGLNTAQD